MRRALEGVVIAAGVAADILLAAMGVVMLAAIVLRQLGVLLAGHEEITTFAMVGMAFLGLPHVYRSGAHVRVETLISRLPEHMKRGATVWSIAVALATCLAFSYFAAGLVWDSWRFGDMSEGLLAIPRWIPQLPILLGLALFALVLIQDLVDKIRGGKASFETSAHDALPE